MQTDLSISGMSCQHCVAAVRNALGSVSDVEVMDVEIGKARVKHTAELSTVEPRIREAVEAEGYSVERIDSVR